MHPAYAVVLAEARSCLAALADAATSADCAGAYERLLIDLDVLNDDVGPSTYPIVSVGLEELAQRLEVALRCLAVFFGVDALGVKLLIDRLHGRAPRA